jgi:diguanylate cyclase (GGDEF)-like protein/PAS domain S-box-containing protein
MPDSKYDKKERLPYLLENLPVGVYRTNPEGKIIKANQILIQMLGYQNISDLENLNVKDLYIKPKDRENHLIKPETTTTRYANIKIRCRDGRTLWCRDYPEAVLDATGKIAFYDGILIDISAEKRTEDKLKKALRQLSQSNKERKKMIAALESLTLEDHLTGLYNRRGFTTIAKEYLQLANRKKTEMYLLYIDLDDLKKINDTYGHNKGDFVLVALAEILQKTFRESDIKARIGGDEFAVFPIDTHKKGVHSALARLEKSIDDYNAATEHQPLLSVSTGISCYNPAKPCSVNELLIKADSLMYEEKRRKQKT